MSRANVTQTSTLDDAGIADIDLDWPHSWFSIQPTSPLPSISAAGGAVIIDGSLSDGTIRELIEDSYDLVVGKL